jgi:hypothetical protein
MSKLHELLAVDGNLTNQANKTRGEVIASFDKKKHLFAERRVTFKPDNEEDKPITESQSDIQETVHNQVDFVSKITAKALDVSYQIDIANTLAKADVVTEDGSVLLTNIPATSLLQLEKRLKEMRDFAASVPTLDPAQGFQPDPDRSSSAASPIYKAREVNKTRTRKVQEPLILAPATDKHPAQVQLITVDKPVGTILEQEWSSLITPATKSSILDRCDILLRAVKKARAKANEQEVDVEKLKVGQKLMNYMFQPLSPKQSS